MTDKRIVLTTAGSKDEADKIAAELVQRRLAACVNVLGPMHSTYRWQDSVETAEEFLLVIKTTVAALQGVRTVVHELHSYELPEFLVIPVESGSEKYLSWIEKNVQ